MATKTTPKPKARKRDTHAARPRRRQPALPGLETPKHPDVEAAAESFVGARDERMELTKAEVATRDRLIATMKAHDLAVYRIEAEDGNLIVRLEEEAKVTVRKEREKKSKKGEAA